MTNRDGKRWGSAMRHVVALLGDSRAFDTYYTNSRYAARYGYDKTFAHVWRGLALADPDAGYDVVHIPDHFRGRTIENNILRLALTDPAIVVILDGIWETLVNKGHFLAYVEARLRDPDGRPTAEMDFAYSADRLVELYKRNALSVSPAGYARRLRKLVSYFRRRRRQVIWMTLPVPPADYVGSTYHAGDYRPPAGWPACLAAVNAAAISVVEAYGAMILDLGALMAETGGPSQCLIDQWHFSESFHARIAAVLDERTRALLADAPGANHVSHLAMLGAPPKHRDIEIYNGAPDGEAAALADLPAAKILLLADELGDIVNPVGDDRAEFERAR